MAHLRLVIAVLALAVAASHAFPLLVGQELIPSGFGLPPPLGFVSPPPFNGQAFSQQRLSHPGVVQASEDEARLPPNLKNPFYRNPRIGAALAKESWFLNGEMEVRQREADKIPRDKIFSILKNAGFV